MKQESERPATAVAASLREAVDAHGKGDWARATAVCRQILRGNPRQAAALHLLGVIAFQAGNLDEAVGRFRAAAAAAPASAISHFHLGVALQVSGQCEAAVASLDQAIRLAAEFAEAHFSRGIALQDLGRHDEALASYERAIAIKPAYADAHYNRGAVLQELGRWDDAVQSYDRAIAAKADHHLAHYNRGLALHNLARLDAALASYDRALSAKPDHQKAHNSRGNVLRDLGRMQDALASYERAVALNPANPVAQFNRGVALHLVGRVPEAFASCDALIASHPNFADTYYHKGVLKLLNGDFREGWKLHERRWDRERGGSARPFPQPLWLGEQTIAGKTIFIHAEQGLGDFIQFARYVPMVVEMGARVVLEAPAALLALAQTLDGHPRLVEPGATVPPFDVHCPIMSLPLAFGTTLASVPAPIPYLHWDRAKAAAWAATMGPKTRPRVGLVWSGGSHLSTPEMWYVNRGRNIALRQIARLNDLAVDFYSLQKGEAAESEASALQNELWPGGNFHDHSAALGDFSDTAALIANLDLVVSVDTSVAHLAGALGKPVWILNRFDTCWRWLLDRDDSPWYPTARLYRQQHPGEWEPVIARIRADLASTFSLTR